MNILGKALCCVAVGAALGLSTVANADPLSSLSGKVAFKYSDYEFAQTPQPGDLVGGIFSVSTINNAVTSLPEWVAGTGGEYLNGFYSNITLDTVTSTGSSTANFTATGGLIVLYLSSSPINASNFDTAGISTSTQLCGGSTCGTPWLTAMFVPGYGWTSTNGYNSTNTVFGDFTDTNPIGGTGNGYMSVANLGGTVIQNGNSGSNFTLPTNFTGTANSAFNTNGYVFTGGTGTPPSPADFLFKSNFNQCGFTNSPSGCDALDSSNLTDTAWSNDPVTGTVPDPGTLALFGLALAGLASVQRRKQKRI